jgi:hypothetical protein
MRMAVQATAMTFERASHCNGPGVLSLDGSSSSAAGFVSSETGFLIGSPSCAGYRHLFVGQVDCPLYGASAHKGLQPEMGRDEEVVLCVLPQSTSAPL